MVEGGDSETVTQSPAHPYTRLLIASAPDPDRITGDAAASAPTDRGEPPSLISPPSGCRFHPRCPYAMARCKVDVPPPIAVDDAPGHWAACWLFDEPTVAAAAADVVDEAAAVAHGADGQPHAPGRHPHGAEEAQP